MNDRFSMNSYLGQHILSLVREGDYAHAGEEKAIDLAMEGVEKNSHRIILDAGCGRGGTAEYLHRNGWGNVIGIDIEARSIEVARDRYPDSRFLTCDVCAVSDTIFECPDIICMFNAFHCFKYQSRALASLLRISRPYTRMVIFDHVNRGGYQVDSLMDNEEPFLPNPLQLAEVEERLISIGWQKPKVRELNVEYVAWYANLVRKIEEARTQIIEVAGEAGYDHVIGLYRGLLNASRYNTLGAAVITTTPAF